MEGQIEKKKCNTLWFKLNRTKKLFQHQQWTVVRIEMKAKKNNWRMHKQHTNITQERIDQHQTINTDGSSDICYIDQLGKIYLEKERRAHIWPNSIIWDKYEYWSTFIATIEHLIQSNNHCKTSKQENNGRQRKSGYTGVKPKMENEMRALYTFDHQQLNDCNKKHIRHTLTHTCWVREWVRENVWWMDGRRQFTSFILCGSSTCASECCCVRDDLSVSVIWMGSYYWKAWWWLGVNNTNC